MLLLTPLLLDDRGWGSGSVGLALSLLTLGMIVMSPPGRPLGRRARPALPGAPRSGAGTFAVGLSALFGDETASALLLVTLLLFGLGLGTATPSIMTAGLEAAPESRIGFASGLLSMSRYVGSIAASVFLTVLVDDDGSGVGVMFTICLVAMLAALGTASALPGQRVVPKARALSDAGDSPA